MQYACFFCQHCIEGRMTFAPIFYGLDCGAYPEKPKGSWHNHGFQMIGMFKIDWERIGGKLKNKKKVMLFRMLSIFYSYREVGILTFERGNIVYHFAHQANVSV